MKKSGMRLGIKNNISPSTPLTDVPGSEGTNSANLAQAERQIKALQEENKKLKDDFSEMSTLYHQLVREATHENYDERRVIALKSQVIQLERQVMALAEAQGSRAAALMEVENSLAGIADCARAHMGEKTVGSSVGGISIPREELTGIVESAESARIKLYKGIESTNPEKLRRPLLMMDRFVKQSPWQPVTLLDVCSGKLEHINLKQVSKLEGQLAQLYKQLTLVSWGLYNVQSSSEKAQIANREVPSGLYERLGAEVSRACVQLNTVTTDLLDLTLLLPAAPWPPLQKPRMQELNTEDVIRALPSFPKSRAAEGRHLVEALLKCYTLNNHMNSLENQALSEELKFHQCVYDLQQDYTQALFTSLRNGYAEFEESTNKLICQPLKVILGNYSALKTEASEEALREFLAVFKQHADQLEDAVMILQPDDNKFDGGGKSALSEFGQQFLKSLNHIHGECRKNRDKLISDLDEIKDQQREHSSDMYEMFRRGDRREKDPAEEYVEIIKRTAELGLDDSLGDNVVNEPRRTDVKRKVNQQGSDERARRRGSLKGNKKEEDGDGEQLRADGSTLTEQLTTGSRRPTSLGDMSFRAPISEPRHTPPTPKSTRLPQRGTPAASPSSSRIPTQKSRASVIPGASPAMSHNIRTPSGVRLTPIAKLNLKPRSQRDPSFAEKPDHADIDYDEQ